MRKFVAILLGIAMLTVNAAYASENEKVKEIMISFESDFSADSIGAVPSVGISTPKSNKITVEAEPGTANKWLKYENMGKEDMFYQFQVTQAIDYFVCEFDINIEKFGNGNLLLCFKDTSNVEIELMHITKNGDLCAADNSVITPLVMGKTYKICAVLSLADGKADVYVDHRKKASGISTSADFNGISLFRFHLYQLAAGGSKPIIYFDNFKSYDSEQPIFKYEQLGYEVREQSSVEVDPAGIADETSMREYMQDTVALYVGQNTYAVDGEVEMLDSDNPNVKVYVENGRSFVPIRFVAESLDGGKEVQYDESAKSVVISDSVHKLVFTEGNTAYILDGEEKQLDAPPRIKENRMFVPIRAISEGMGKKVTYEKSGMIVIADRDNFFNFREDLHVFRKLASDMIFRTPSGKWMADTIEQKYPGNGHPRLLINNEKINDIKNGIATNELMAQWYERVVSRADEMLGNEPLKYELPDGIRLLTVSRAARDRIQTLAFAYLISGETKYADKAYSEMENVCSFKDWNPYHFLDTAEMSEAVAIGYDWLYNYMSQSQRDTVRNALCRLGLDQVMEDHNNVAERKRSFKWAQSPVADNWNLVCNGGTLIAAMAIADEEPQLSEKVFDAGMELIKKAILLYAPDGAWYEGPGYWEYATNYYIDFVASLDSVYGDTFGYIDTPGVADTAYYINALTSSGGMFNFHDGSADRISSPTMFFIADKTNDTALAQLRIDNMIKENTPGKLRDLIWYNYHKMSDNSAELRNDYYFRDTEVAVMRSNWIDESSIYLAIHAGKVNVYHGHMDIGQFIIDAYGTRYVHDLGSENYNLGDSAWNLYRNRAEGHNVLVINPDKSGGQLLSGDAIVDRFESNSGCALAVMDMTSAYVDKASSVKRGYKLTNGRSMIIIQDEIHTKAPSEIYWFMHTDRDITVADDGKSAKIGGKYRDMYVYLLDETVGSFSVMDAVPLPTSPNNPKQNLNLGFKKLVFRAENVTDLTIPVAFSFGIPGMSIEDMYTPEVVPLDEWTLDAEISGEAPKLDEITINDATIEGFDPDVLSYVYRVKDGEPMPEINGKADSGNVTVKMPDDLPGYAVVTAASKEDENFKNSYVIRIDKEILTKGPAGTKQLSISGVEASSVPQPENIPMNTLDGHLDTRWSAYGRSDIVYDLGNSYKISHVGLAVYQDVSQDGRRQYFDVYVSEDGENWNFCYSGETSGETLEKEIFPITPQLGRYIKIDCKGTSVGNWNSVTEFAAYGPDNQ